MSKPIVIAVLHDSSEFGGHERAFLTWLPYLLGSPLIAAVVVWTPRDATSFRRALAAVSSVKLTVVAHAFVKRRAEPFLAPLRMIYGFAVRRFVANLSPDVVLLLQGRIENLATPLVWLSRHIRVISYIPMAHLGPEMGRNRWISILTDRLKRAYYGRPQAWITVSQSVSFQLRRAGALAPIYVVENVPPSAIRKFVRLRSFDRAALPEAFAPGERVSRTALFMGRFDAGQKGLDRLAGVLRRDAADLHLWRFVFVGQGPAEIMLRELIVSGVIKGEVRVWTDDPGSVLQSCDILLLPSRYEGVPLIMLEAMQAGTPILASPIDVFKAYLPPECIYEYGGALPLDKGLERVLSADGLRAYENQGGAVLSRLTLDGSGNTFLQAVVEAAELMFGSTQ